MLEHDDVFTDVEIARMLGFNPVTVRQWRVKNKKLGHMRYGPPYEIRGGHVVYPKSQFRAWCTSRTVVNGVPQVNLPVTANLELIHQATGNGAQDSTIASL